MYLKLIYGLICLGVVVSAFFAGVYYSVSGIFELPQSVVNTFSSNGFVRGELVRHSDKSVSIRTADGTEEEFEFGSPFQILYTPPPIDLSLSEIRTGSVINIYTVNGKAVQVHVIEVPQP